MGRGIDKRLRDLETSTGGQACEEWGDGGGVPASWEVVWVDPEEPAEPKWCGACGRQYAFVVTWGDIPDPRGAA